MQTLKSMWKILLYTQKQLKIIYTAFLFNSEEGAHLTTGSSGGHITIMGTHMLPAAPAQPSTPKEFMRAASILDYIVPSPSEHHASTLDSQ